MDIKQAAYNWFTQLGWKPFPFQEEAWDAYLSGKNGLVNAPTGTGKTYSLLIPALLEFLREESRDGQRTNNGLRVIWITPIRALAREIEASAERAVTGLGLSWKVAVRSGDTSSVERTRQRREAPEILITTPESLHLLLASKGYAAFFKQVRAVVVDEWHELVGSKRGVQIELALSRLKTLAPQLKIWGISATIGNLDEALDVLLGQSRTPDNYQLVRAQLPKKLLVETLLPEHLETFPWSGHLGIKLIQQVVPLLEASNSTLIFTNTRAQCEIWYHQLLEVAPDLAGAIAMHHGSISRELRDWVEQALHEGTLKAVVCTSSLDLGVDFRPVDTIIQIGSPKGVARFMQRAGRSGHQPGATSKIYFVPTHSLEILEGAALREAIAHGGLESRIPYLRSFDVLIQYLLTLAVSEGFNPAEILPEIRNTFSYSSLSDEEWHWLLRFITQGGDSLRAYDAFQKVQIEDQVYRVTSRRIALQHRLQIGTIVSDTVLNIKYVSGGFIGSVEEWFVSQLKPGDVFWFAGRSLEFVRVKEMTVQVRSSTKKTGRIPSWQGGRMPLSSELGAYLRQQIDNLHQGRLNAPELKALVPLAEVQARRSHLPCADELLVEYFSSKEGYHLLIYPFEGRFVHEGLAAILAYRLSQRQPLSFSLAMNDYGLELLSETEIQLEEALADGLFSTTNLSADIAASINAAELARRRFREIAGIAGLVFKGYPGKHKRDRHLQASAQLFFSVFEDYEPNNLLLLQAYDEVMTFQLEEARLRQTLQRIQDLKIVLQRPAKATPFAFPIMVDRLRGRLSSEKLEDRIRKMKIQLEKG
ncbi:MAG: ligase-associated DNA damage response DEXH box helicase [Lewinellaceae bacterium]|nr:ligase-associated DNA damage response DEXH box helicase [Lewinellaceae bacterium]